MLQAGIETWLILCQSDIFPLIYRHFSIKKGIIWYIFIYAYQLLEYSIHEKSFAFMQM